MGKILRPELSPTRTSEQGWGGRGGIFSAERVGKEGGAPGRFAPVQPPPPHLILKNNNIYLATYDTDNLVQYTAYIHNPLYYCMDL